MIPQRPPSFDDLTIQNHEQLIRFCRAWSQIAQHENGEYVLSDQVFARQKDGCSVEIQSLLSNAGISVHQRTNAVNSFGALSVSAGQVRQIRNKDKDGKESENLCVAYTPIDAGERFGPNSYHADIFPGPSGSACAALKEAATVIVPIDQATAAIEYAKKFR